MPYREPDRPDIDTIIEDRMHEDTKQTLIICAAIAGALTALVTGGVHCETTRMEQQHESYRECVKHHEDPRDCEEGP